ncbi:uncharacterized protein [Palaemon carinicauda]|uniref:uncharacterized protein n=1 Tax=Palaemon carinicauda TaxID=392227 RepID=UPI0035B68387
MSDERPLKTPSRPPRICSQYKNIIVNVFRYFRKHEHYDHISDIEMKTAKATHVSRRSVSRFRAQGKVGTISSPPRQKRPAPVFDSTDHIARDAIRREILAFYERGVVPTLDLLLERVKEPPISFAGGNSSLRVLIEEDLGFSFKKQYRRRPLLMERDDILAERSKYLREIETNRRSIEPRPEIFIDEIMVKPNVSVEYTSTVKGAESWFKGASYIISLAGGKDGFIPGALMIRPVNAEDYEETMNHDIFKEWFLHQLLPNIPSKSLIVMDNAPYHSKLLKKAPTRITSKSETVKWLQDNSIEHDPTYSKAELLQIVAIYKNSFQRFEIDDFASAAGHRVLRLPKHYCQFNPVELILAQIKDEIEKSNSNRDESIENIIRQAVVDVISKDWQKWFHHALDIENDYRRKFVAYERAFESFVMNLPIV